jgi:hypothetical protein
VAFRQVLEPHAQVLLDVDEEFREIWKHKHIVEFIRKIRQQTIYLKIVKKLLRWDVLTSSFREAQSSTPKNDPSNQEIHLKIPLLTQGSKLSSSNPSCEVSTLHFYVR